MGVALALGVSPLEILLGALGRADDPHSGGRQLPMHLSDPERRIGSVSSAIAGHIPHAVGAAVSRRAYEATTGSRFVGSATAPRPRA